MISTEQRFTLLAALAANTNWDVLTTEEVQLGIREAQRAGGEFTLFTKNGFRVLVGDFFRKTGELAIQIPALPRLTPVELRAKFPWIKEEGGIERDTSLTEAITLELGTVLRPNEASINGSEYEQRMPKLGLLGYQHAQWLIEHQDEFPKLTTLLRKVYIDFPGLVVVRADGSRFFPYLCSVGRRWGLDWCWLEVGLRSRGRFAVSGK